MAVSEERSEEMTQGIVEGVIAALTDKHGQLDIRLRNVVIGMPGARMSVQIDGIVTMSVHMRELTDGEKSAHIEGNIAAARA